MFIRILIGWILPPYRMPSTAAQNEPVKVTALKYINYQLTQIALHTFVVF